MSKNANVSRACQLELVKRAVNRDISVANASRGGMLETHIFVRQLVDRLQCLTNSQDLYGSCS